MTIMMESESIVSTKTPPEAARSFARRDEFDPETLIRRIARLIRRDTNLGVQEMKVVFENGKVILTGYCRTFYTKQLAQQAAMTLIGDVDLVNRIHVAN